MPHKISRSTSVVALRFDHFKMTWLFTVIVALNLVNFISALMSCPADYRRFSEDHSFCKKANSSCSFLAKGLKDEAKEIETVLRIHNYYRSKVATGKVALFPTAANMLELTWDKKLQRIAQKWAEQCELHHDCKACREVRSFNVGQNIAINHYNTCLGNCDKPNWKQIIHFWYNIIDFRSMKVLDNYASSIDPEYVNLKQIIWAKTFKIGCGFVAFREGKGVTQFYVCNYGPAGNILGEPTYEKGTTCSNCPINSCCGDECQVKTYPGLCRLKNFPPFYPPKDLVFFCDFGRNESDCDYNSVGDETWNLTKTIGGNFLSAIVPEQKNAILEFPSRLYSHESENLFCMNVNFRTTSNIAGQKRNSTLEIEVLFNEYFSIRQTATPASWPDFIDYTLLIKENAGGNIRFSLKFSVPANTPPQFVEIRYIKASGNHCEKLSRRSG